MQQKLGSEHIRSSSLSRKTTESQSDMTTANIEEKCLKHDTTMCGGFKFCFSKRITNLHETQQKDGSVSGKDYERGHCAYSNGVAEGNVKMSHIEILPAYHGEAFIIYASKGDNNGVIVVDGGPAQSRIKVLRRLEQFDKIDLMVLTHYDSDHISGLNTFLEQQTDSEKSCVKELWVNCAREIDMKEGNNVSYSQAYKMANMLCAVNEKNDGGIAWKERIAAGYERDLGFATVNVIGPQAYILDIRQKKYEETMSDDVSSARVEGDIKIPLETLSQNEKMTPSTTKDNELANIASIAFIIECDGLRALMLGDSFPDPIEKELRKNYSEEKPLKVDVVKVAHHGSRNNISNSLLDIIDCQDYIISTNGGTGNTRHPDREALANILCHPRRDRSKTIRLFFNYDIEYIQKRTGLLLTKEETKKYNCEIYSPVSKYPL